MHTTRRDAARSHIRLRATETLVPVRFQRAASGLVTTRFAHTIYPPACPSRRPTRRHGPVCACWAARAFCTPQTASAQAKVALNMSFSMSSRRIMLMSASEAQPVTHGSAQREGCVTVL